MEIFFLKCDKTTTSSSYRHTRMEKCQGLKGTFVPEKWLKCSQCKEGEATHFHIGHYEERSFSSKYASMETNLEELRRVSLAFGPEEVQDRLHIMIWPMEARETIMGLYKHLVD